MAAICCAPYKRDYRRALRSSYLLTLAVAPVGYWAIGQNGNLLPAGLMGTRWETVDSTYRHRNNNVNNTTPNDFNAWMASFSPSAEWVDEEERKVLNAFKFRGGITQEVFHAS